MKITQIKQQVKNPERVSVFVDGKYSFSLTLDQLLQEKLKKDTELDDVRLKQLQKGSNEGKMRARALEWLMGRPHSTREFKDYLYRKKVEKEHVDQVTEEFTRKRYLDDASFARWFAEGRIRKNKSTRAIKAELASKGIPQETIQSVVTELVVEDTEEESLKVLVNKLRKRSRYQDDKKLITYLLSKGFAYSDVASVLKQDDLHSFG